jgi:hypothetical protein
VRDERIVRTHAIERRGGWASGLSSHESA